LQLNVGTLASVLLGICAYRVVHVPDKSSRPTGLLNPMWWSRP